MLGSRRSGLIQSWAPRYSAWIGLPGRRMLERHLSGPVSSMPRRRKARFAVQYTPARRGRHDNLYTHVHIYCSASTSSRSQAPPRLVAAHFSINVRYFDTPILLSIADNAISQTISSPAILKTLSALSATRRLEALTPKIKDQRLSRGCASIEDADPNIPLEALWDSGEGCAHASRSGGHQHARSRAWSRIVADVRIGVPVRI